jgi:hypothetical protein
MDIEGKYFCFPTSRGMNRAVQKMHQRRCALKNNLYGGGLAVNPEASFLSENGVPYAENQYTNECYSQPRPGALENAANPALAQVAMAGGYGGSRRQGCGLMKGGYNVMSASQLMALAGKSGGKSSGRSSRKMRGGRRGCGCNLRGQRGGGCGCSSWKLKGGYQCGKPETAWLGGKRRGERTRKMRGGNKGGFEMAVAQNIGGNGPIAEPVRTAIPCDARAGMQNPFTATPLSPDARTAYGYSLTPNTTTHSVQAGGGVHGEMVPLSEYAQTGAGYGGNAYNASCYRAPGSEMPVYPATSAGFHFTPSTEGGSTLPDGVTAFNEVVAHTARLGGARRSTRRSRKTQRSKKAKKSKRSRRH